MTDTLIISVYILVLETENLISPLIKPYVWGKKSAIGDTSVNCQSF